MQRIEVNKPSTVYVKFNEPIRRFIVLDRNKNLYFERFLSGKTPRIKFNIPNIGLYMIATPCEIVKMVNLEKPSFSVQLPPFERERVKNLVIVDNPHLEGTPARIFTFDGIVEKGKEIYKYPAPMRIFFLLHEVGHLYYKTEKYCDLFALAHFLEMGYNMSTAMYCLTNVLKRNRANSERIKFIYQHLIKEK